MDKLFKRDLKNEQYSLIRKSLNKVIENYSDFKEISQNVYETYKSSTIIAHLHIRDDANKGTMDIKKFQ